jgi:zinc transporter ZupT
MSAPLVTETPDRGRVAPARRPGTPILWLILPLLVLAGLVAVLLFTRPLDDLTAGAPPVEELSVERVTLSPDLITLSLRADGSAPIAIAQVQVDGAYRQFAQSPDGRVGRLGRATITIPYPWVEGEAHHIALVTSTGAVFDHTIEVAQATPGWSTPTLLTLALVGTLLGIAPVATGLLAYPGLRRLGPAAIRFVLALTVGLLAFLLIDTLTEGMEAAALSLERLRGSIAVPVIALFTTGLLLLAGRRSGRPLEGLALSTFIALGIGLHNLGEGLAVGAAIAAGEAALATFLVIGFTIHNVSEGLGIATPLIEKRPTLLAFVGLAALAGLPAVLGVILGAQAVSPFLTAICFAVGAGAILQVIIEVSALIMRRDGSAAILSPPAVGGFIVGLAVMYLTALFV